ncbi:MAG TPA: tetratricopeptide repeat protein [Candidatus Eisenbacteria bacterium]|nr:tetratricopeptide repeat protein [Candidatus Eisenbacteria bacterium]
MSRRPLEKAGIFLLALGVWAAAARAQAPPPRPRPQPTHAPVTNITIDGNEAMFTTMCALYASGFDSEVSADNWSTFRAQLRTTLRRQQGPAVDAVRDFYRKHTSNDLGEMLSAYVWFGIVSGPAPKFQPVLRRDELPPEVLPLEGFSEVLSHYYVEQDIGQLWRQVQPVYNQEIERLHDPISNIVLVANAYLRQLSDPSQPRTFTVIVEPLVGRITNVRNYGDHYSIILSGSEDIPIDVVRHAYLHFLLDPLPLMYPHVIAVKRPVYDIAAKAPRLAPDLKDDFPSWFAECLVRAVELKLRKLSPSEREVALSTNDADGYVLVRPVFTALTTYEQNEPSMRNYFPDMIRGIDVKAEVARASALTFAPPGSEQPAAKLSGEAVTPKHHAAPADLPTDQDTVAQLTAGERFIADRNPRAAEAAFKAVLAKYPDQDRALYGLGLVALLDHDADRAREIFGKLTTGPHASAEDPMILAWSHVFLARVLDAEGQLEESKSEYQAALAVQGAPARAQAAAQKELGDLNLRKPAERP